MNDNIIMENYLAVLKSNVEVFVHGTLESSYKDNQQLLKKCLDETIECQRETYEKMVELKMYQVEDVEQTKISKIIKKLQKN